MTKSLLRNCIYSLGPTIQTEREFTIHRHICVDFKWTHFNDSAGHGRMKDSCWTLRQEDKTSSHFSDSLVLRVLK